MFDKESVTHIIAMEISSNFTQPNLSDISANQIDLAE